MGGSGRGVLAVGEGVVVGVPVCVGDGVAGRADGGGDSYPGVAVAFGRRWCFRWCSCELAGSGVGVALAGAVCAGCVIFASGVGGVGDGGVLGVGAGGDGPMVRVPGTLGGSALLGLLLAIPGGGVRVRVRVTYLPTLDLLRSSARVLSPGE